MVLVVTFGTRNTSRRRNHVLLLLVVLRNAAGEVSSTSVTHQGKWCGLTTTLEKNKLNIQIGCLELSRGRCHRRFMEQDFMTRIHASNIPRQLYDILPRYFLTDA